MPILQNLLHEKTDQTKKYFSYIFLIKYDLIYNHILWLCS
jgi:hypothetical protein